MRRTAPLIIQKIISPPVVREDMKHPRKPHNPNPAFAHVIPRPGFIVRPVLGNGTVSRVLHQYSDGNYPMILALKFHLEPSEGSFVVPEPGRYRVRLREESLIISPIPLGGFPYVVHFDVRVGEGLGTGKIVGDLGDNAYLTNVAFFTDRSVVIERLEAGQRLLLTYNKVNSPASKPIDATFSVTKLEVIIEKVEE